MKNKTISLIILSGILFLNTDLLFCQIKLDHKIFLNELKHSGDNIYNNRIAEYDSYLKDYPYDVTVRIEKCKFIQNAQYDEYEEYNPNQEALDTCISILVRMFPKHPEVLIYQTTMLWGEELMGVFETAEETIAENPEEWSKENLGMLYSKMAEVYYGDSDYKTAYNFIQKAILNNEKYKFSIEYARILIELDNPVEALNALNSGQDSIIEPWQLSQKADLLLELKAYSEALQTYNQIGEIDSTFNNNYELSRTLEAIGQDTLARNYLLADTSKNWDKKSALNNLLIHDLKFQNGSVCIATYNKYRDYGYTSDPLGLYRLKLFFSHPFQSWKFRDILGILTLFLVVAILLLIPSIWILPVYFVGHHWNIINKPKKFESHWDLRWFWFVSVGYLLAAFIALIVNAEYFYSIINSAYYDADLFQEKESIITIIFILVFAIFGIASFYKINPRFLLSSNWSIHKSILLGLGFLIVFKIISGIYIRFGISNFDISIEDLTSIPNFLLSSIQNLEAVISKYGNLVGLLLFCLLVPLYEEIIFRGVILDSCQRYIGFKSANTLQAILFSIGHLNLFLMPVYFIFGLITGKLRKESGGLLPGIVFHVFNNFLGVLILILRQ